MPSHMHAIIWPLPSSELDDLLHSQKSFTAHRANQLRGATGSFWQDESYDHLIRDDEDLWHAIRYLDANPSKAGLRDWEWCGGRLIADGEKVIARGLAAHVRDACIAGMPNMKKAAAANPIVAVAIDPELLKRIYDDMVTGAGAEVLFHTQLATVEAADGNVTTVTVCNKNGLSAYRAKAYVDCTGDGDLAAWAGAEFEKGDVDGDLQPATHCFVISNVDSYTLHTGPSVHFFDPESPIHKAIDSGRYPLIVDLHSCFREIGPNVFGFNTGHVYDVDNTDATSVSKALIHGRKQVAQYHEAFKEFHPAFAASFLATTGSLLGVRETRRIIGDYKLVLDDYLEKRSFPDEICRNAYNIDVHKKKDKTIEPGRDIEKIKADLHKEIKQLAPG